MKNQIAKLGGTAFEVPLFKLAAAIRPFIARDVVDEELFWIRDGISESMQQELQPLRSSVLEIPGFFQVPANNWLVNPIGVAASDLEAALSKSLEHSDFELVCSPTRANLTFASNWAPVSKLSKNTIAKIASRKLQLAFVPKAQSGDIRNLIPLEVWENTSSGNISSPAWNNVFSELARGEGLEKDVDRASSFKNLFDINLKIDVVYLWVDGSDPEWLSKKQPHENSQVASHGSASSRFTSRNELYFSIRSLLEHASWVNKIWVVTDGQTPELGELNGEITLVDHKDFIPSEFLPTFNSHTITANLHRIAGLSEHFLYLNDDIFFGRTLSPATWFDTLGRSVIRYTKTLVPGFETQGLSTIHRIRHNTIALAQQSGYKVTTRSIQHGPHPLQKTVMNDLWSKHPQALQRTCSSKFRSETDIVPEWLHNFLAISSARAFVGGPLTYRYVVLNAKASLPKMLGLFTRRLPAILCLNDVSELSENQRASEKIIQYRLRALTNLFQPKK